MDRIKEQQLGLFDDRTSISEPVCALMHLVLEAFILYVDHLIRNRTKDLNRQGRQSRYPGAAADRIQGCFRLTAALLRGVAAQNDENLISRAPPAPFPGRY